MSSVAGTRTCAGCVKKAHFTELFKFPALAGLRRGKPSDQSRHGYLHFDEACYKKAAKKNAFSFVLKRRLTEKELNDIKRDFDQQLASHAPTRNHDSGSR